MDDGFQKVERPLGIVVVGNTDVLHSVPTEMRPWVTCCADHIREKVLSIVEKRADVSRVQLSLNRKRPVKTVFKS